jgi:hypothetical protein
VPNDTFGTVSNSSGYSGYPPIYSNTVSLATGRTMANGDKHIQVVKHGVYFDGYGASRSGYTKLGSSKSSTFTVAAGDGETFSGYRTSSTWTTDDSTAKISIYFTGQVTFSRGGSGTTYDNSGYTFSGGGLAGKYTYYEAPTAPTALVAVALSSTSVGVTFAAPSDNGGTAVTRYLVEYSDDDFATVAGSVYTTSTGATLTDLTPGTDYTFRVGADNAVTTARSTTSVYSATATATTLSGARVSDGTSYQSAEILVGNGTTWSTPEVLVGDGTTWSTPL